MIDQFPIFLLMDFLFKEMRLKKKKEKECPSNKIPLFQKDTNGNMNSRNWKVKWISKRQEPEEKESGKYQESEELISDGMTKNEEWKDEPSIIVCCPVQYRQRFQELANDRKRTLHQTLYPLFLVASSQ